MGFLQTLETLRAHGTVVSGGGENLSKASAAQYFIVGGRKIAIVSATEIERYSHYTKEAGEDSAGVLKTQQTDTLREAIRSAAKTSDYVIAYIHWGEEGQVYYGGDQEDIAKICVDAGADAVIGGHPHRLQGVSFVEDVPVAYSLGNFWFSTGTLYTTIAQIQIDGDGELSLSMLPCIQKGVRTYMLESEEEKKEFYHYLADISSNVGIDEDGRIHSYMNVTEPGISPYAYTSGRRYGMRVGDVDLDMNVIDIVGNTVTTQN
jgi:poly-gamma-glutamate synthesis protein (capsule biosynthesis protein)